MITEPNTPDPYQMPRDWGAPRKPPGTPGHPLGTTNNGGDVLYGVIWGARTSLYLSLLVVSITAIDRRHRREPRRLPRRQAWTRS